MNDPIIEVDLTQFSNWARNHLGRDYPKAVVDAFVKIAELGRDAGRTLTKNKFKLHTEFIPRGIRSLPFTNAQKRAAGRALVKYGDMNAWVFLRGASDRRKSLMFMAHHEGGEKREAQKKYIAIPTRRMKQKAFRGTTGRVKKRWKPKTLLKQFTESGARFTGKTTSHSNYQRRRRMPGAAFLIRGYRGDITIARRIARGIKELEHLYVLKESVKIKKEWGFIEHVKNEIKGKYGSVIIDAMSRL